jgi:hypothetical protein
VTGFLFLALAVVTVVYVASEDDYRHLGVSRWSTYDAQAITVAAVASSLVVSVVCFVALRRRGLAVTVGGLAAVAILLNYLARASMTN